MAYEAMNNAGALKLAADRHPQRTRTCRSPRRSAPSRAISRAWCRVRAYTSVRHTVKRSPSCLPRSSSSGGAHEEYARGSSPAARCSTSSAFSMSGRRRPQHRSPLPVLRRARRQRRTVPGSRRDARAGLRAGRESRDKGHGVVKFGREDRGAGEVEGLGAAIYQGVRQSLIKEAKKDDKDRRHHRRHAVGHRARPVRQGIPQSLLRRRHRRAARRDLRRRTRDAKASSPSPPSTRPSCSAPMTRWCTTSHPALPVRFAMTAPGWSAPDGPTLPALRRGPYLGCLPGFVIMAAADETELVHMVRHQVRSTIRPSALRYPRGEGSGIAEARRRACRRDRPRAACARGHEGRTVLLRTGSPTASRRTRAREPRPCRPPSRTRVSPSRSTSTCCFRLARRHRCGSRSRKAPSAASAPTCCRRWPKHGARQTGSGRSWCCPTIFSDQDSPAAMYATAGLDHSRHRRQDVRGAGAEPARRGDQARADVDGRVPLLARSLFSVRSFVLARLPQARSRSAACTDNLGLTSKTLRAPTGCAPRTGVNS